MLSHDLAVSPPQGGAVLPLDDLAQKARGFIEAAKAGNSRRAYRSDWRQFEGWCCGHGLACLPAVPETVALYLTALAADHKPASLTRSLTSITKAHQAAGLPTPASMDHAGVSMRGNTCLNRSPPPFAASPRQICARDAGRIDGHMAPGWQHGRCGSVEHLSSSSPSSRIRPRKGSFSRNRLQVSIWHRREVFWRDS